MKLRLLLFLALACTPLAGMASPPVLNPAVSRTLSEVSISGGGIHQHYTEWSRGLPNAASLPDPVNRESGTVGLFRFALAKRFPATGGWAEVRYDFGTGNTDYAGHTQGGAPLLATTDNTMHDVRARVGYPVALTRNLDVLPFLEGGYYQWDRAVANGTPSAIEEVYTHGYVGAGGRLFYAATPRWVFSATVDAGSTVAPGMDAVSPIQGSATLGTHAYAGVALQEDYRLRGDWHLFARASYRYFGYGLSSRFPISALVNGQTFNGTASEPNSTTEQVRYSVGVAYNF
ncbi:MAG: hypothetical protein B7Z66_07245 [Chromatiales bacterium 21-64-14]|nr:MAG: hypothetical protein B7Z66_07245 [Chromatiales bacterium 21-64-14]HQU15471.1 hypothetical protein [Gammaproteobacteria bacterium]